MESRPGKPPERFNSEAEIIAAINAAHHESVALIKEAESLEAEADRSAANVIAGSVARNRELAESKRKFAAGILEHRCKVLGEKLFEFRTGTFGFLEDQ